MLYDKTITCANLIFAKASNHVKILDLGCNEGALLDALRELDPPFQYDFYGVDILPEVRKGCLRKGYKNIKIADLEKGIEYDSNSFDFVNAGEVIEHIHDTERFLGEVFRVLVPKGMAIITTPNLSFVGNIYFILKRSQLATVASAGSFESRRHVSYFSPKALKNRLERAGFEKVQFHRHQREFYGKGLLASIILLSSHLPFFNSQMNYNIVASAEKPALPRYHRRR